MAQEFKDKKIISISLEGFAALALQRGELGLSALLSGAKFGGKSINDIFGPRNEISASGMTSMGAASNKRMTIPSAMRLFQFVGLLSRSALDLTKASTKARFVGYRFSGSSDVALRSTACSSALTSEKSSFPEV